MLNLVTQSGRAKRDAKLLQGLSHIVGINTPSDLARYRYKVVVLERPEGWADSRLHTALINRCAPNLYSPFGGSTTHIGGGVYAVEVFTGCDKPRSYE